MTFYNSLSPQIENNHCTIFILRFIRFTRPGLVAKNNHLLEITDELFE